MKKQTKARTWFMMGMGASLALGGACGGKSTGAPSDGHNKTTVEAKSEPPIAPLQSELQKKLATMPPTRALVASDQQKQLSKLLDAHFKRFAQQRYYVHLDKPMYQPGESIWFRIWELSSADFQGNANGHGVMAELVSPKGAIVLSKRIQANAAGIVNDFELPPSVPGGEYILRVHSDLGGSAERPFMVSQYQPPQIKKTAEFLRKAYGPGDKVAAAISLHRGTGEALSNKEVTAVVTLAGRELGRYPVTTDGSGEGLIKFELPKKGRVEDGLMTLMVEDGGVTESLQKRIPILAQTLSFEMFPEGGDLVTGLPSRVYFSAKNTMGKPADVTGRVIDDKGNTVLRFESFKNGLGRFDITPEQGVAYKVEIDKPSTITATYELPQAKSEGCVIQAVDDYQSAAEELRVGVWCSEDREVIATNVLREKRLGESSIAVKVGEPSLVAMPINPGIQGAMRFTLMSEELEPLAERLIYRGLGDDLEIEIETDRQSYAPRDKVELAIKATDLRGKPVSADFSVAVVDDTVLNFADDKSAHLLSRLYLESEMPGQEIEEPNFYFSDEPKAAAGIDMVLGTQGWRRFDWQKVKSPPPPVPETTAAWGRDMAFDDEAIEGAALPMAAPIPDMVPKPEPAPPPADPMAANEPMPENKPMPAKAEKKKEAFRPRGRLEDNMARQQMAGGLFAGDARRANAEKFDRAMDKDWAGEADEEAPMWSWAAVRQFPAPNYQGRYDGPRTDFRETIFWAPSVKTDDKGTAELDFYLSDAVTSFRVTAEGVSKGGLPGSHSELITSKLPVSLAVKMPLEVSNGDIIELPVTLRNETDRPYEVDVDSEFGAAFKVLGGVPDKVSLKGGERRTFFAKLEVVGDGKDAADGLMRVAMDTSNLRDEMKRTVKVVPQGFPQTLSFSGTVEDEASHEFELAGIVSGTVQASVTMYPSPLATMMTGTEALIREPYGCFEQASSANYPNIMVLNYLEENDAADPAIVKRTMNVLDKGYDKLTGYESPMKGYEWFGGDPGHEALTAYGLLEFTDMQKVYGDVDSAMVERTRAWLKSRRDGKGGYERDPKALDSFGRANAEVTNGYITYALSEAGDKELTKELEYQRAIAKKSQDPYLLAMATATLSNLEPGSADTLAAAKKLASLQAKDGAFSGAEQSITMSGGEALTIESTSLAVLALLKQGDAYRSQVDQAIKWLGDHRDGYGNFSSTQATVLALKAMAEYTSATRVTQASGVATIYVNGRSAGRIAYEKGQKEALVFDDISAALKPGKNRIEVKLDSEASLPYSIAVSYRSKMPPSNPEAVVGIESKLAKSSASMGEAVSMDVRVENRSDKGQPMALARVGIPGGLSFQTWQIEELVDKQVIDFFETREREVVLYFRSMAPSAVKDVRLELLASVPGEYVAPASQSYLYYTDELRDWSEPLKMRISKK